MCFKGRLKNCIILIGQGEVMDSRTPWDPRDPENKTSTLLSRLINSVTIYPSHSMIVSTLLLSRKKVFLVEDGLLDK